PLAVGAPRVLFSEGGDPRHAATIRFATQPGQEDALQQLGVEPVCLGRSVLAGNRDTTDNGLGPCPPPVFQKHPRGSRGGSFLIASRGLCHEDSGRRLLANRSEVRALGGRKPRRRNSSSLSSDGKGIGRACV